MPSATAVPALLARVAAALVRVATVPRVALGLAASLAAALHGLSSAFRSVPLRYDPSGVGPGCPALLPATRRALDHAAVAPGLALGAWLAGSAVVVVLVARERLPAGVVRPGAVVLLASAGSGALLCFELYAYRSPLLAFFLFFAIPVAFVVSLVAVLAFALASGTSAPARRWYWTVWGAFVLDVLVLPWVVGALSPTDEPFVCM